MPSNSVGLEEIDGQRRELFSYIDMLGRAMRSRDRTEIGRVFELLACLVVTHYDAEELLMLETSYPDRARHKTAHDQLVAEFLRLKSHYETTGAVSPARFRASGWLDALELHIAGEDMPMARHVVEQRNAQAGASLGQERRAAPGSGRVEKSRVRHLTPAG